ncbi:hypothetical protein HMPREF0290_2491 [Corynebacterium efficiens YS-314]|uniref:Secreted protein n=1 Tax=Corynebacterium efficiens (strain DSM 44549 / YS-314 / AJ 12310 / JCM 11189 / NBRC 100395) TaxID=196164 RepID=Q8FTY7_COREF|nr:hypothetical protein [Corynebacterium efficiens]EEW48848.1 hypothetical protein HMPREF0290_2491 [Corynebacterium efficiens YS-314]BAC17045.1 hypothetical protein [Corynebacterium efficiens YS-314]
MKSLPRFAPLIAILVLLVLVAIGGSALANNTSAPEVDAETATVRLNTGSDPDLPRDQPSSRSTTSPEAPEPDTERQASFPAQSADTAPIPDQVPAPAYNPAPAPAPRVPLNYQYWEDDDDDWDDDWDDHDDNDGDDDWDDD